VRAAAAFAVPDERLGQDVAAAVALAPGRAATPRELRRWLLERLAPDKVPRRLWFVDPDDVPRTASGKVQREELAARFLDTRYPASGMCGDELDSALA
jgi:acyl-CoA synthetase (AMP-forming)/AMP-acid ligase II